MSAPVQHATDLEAFRELLKRETPEPYAYLTLLGLSPAEARDVEHDAQRGLSYATCEHLARNMDIGVDKLSRPLQITSRPEEGRLRPDESQRLLNVARAYGRVLRFFEGDADAAQRWMLKPALAFDETKPLEVATTESGARAVETLLDQLDFGVYP